MAKSKDVKKEFLRNLARKQRIVSRAETKIADAQTERDNAFREQVSFLDEYVKQAAFLETEEETVLIVLSESAPTPEQMRRLAVTEDGTVFFHNEQDGQYYIHSPKAAWNIEDGGGLPVQFLREQDLGQLMAALATEYEASRKRG